MHMKVTPARPTAQAIAAIERFAAADQIASRASRVVRDDSQRDASSVDEKVKALRQAKSEGTVGSAAVPPSSSSGARTLQHGSAVNSSTGSNSSDDQHIKALKELLARGDITAAQFNDAVVVAAAQAHAPTGGEIAARSRFFASSRPWLLQSFVGPDERRRVDRILRETAEAAQDAGGAAGAAGDEFQALRYLREFKTVDAAGGALRESLGWRRAVMEPLLRAPAGVMDQLMTERIWLLPQPNRRGNPVIVFNAAKAIAHPTPAQQQEMVLATLFVLEKAVACSDNPLVEVDIVMNRTRADDAADMGGKQGLAMITGLRGRFELLAKMLRLHYPGRIGSCSIFPPGPIVRFGVRTLLGLGVSFGFDVQVRDPGAMREFFGAAMLPTDLGGDAPYSFALSDVMLPMMKLQDYSSVALHFDDAEMERKYGAWVQRSFCALRPRAILGAAAAAVADGWMRRKRSAALGQQQPMPCGHVSNGDVLLLLGLWALYYVVARRVFRDAALRRWDGAASVAFAVLLQVPALQRFARLTGGECASSDEQLSAERFHEQSTFVLAVFGWAACIAPLRVSKGMSAVLAAWACWVLPALAGGHAASDVHGMSIGGYHAVFGLLLLVAAGLMTWGRERVAREHFRTLNRQSQALAAAQEELNSLRAQTRSTPLVCVDTDLRVTVWNSAMAELTGWHSRDAVGLDFVDELVGHEARGAVRRRLGVLLSQPQDSAATLELPVLTHAAATRSSAGARHGKVDAAPTAAGANGRGAGEREISLLCNIASRVNGAGVAHGVTILAQDITERVRLEGARKNFVSSFSHELRTPLAGVMGMLELLSGQPLSREAQRLIHKAQISSNLLLNLVNDILDMSRIEAGKMELASRPFRIKRALLQTADLVKYQAEMKGLKVTVSLKGRVPDAVVGDVMRFRQVLLNLLSNAVKFTVKGSIAVRVSCDFVEEASAASEGGVKLRVRVRDTGIGIQPASLPALFSMFSKVDTDNELVNNASGCGLGLAISSRLVHLMGGEISVASEPGSGSSFVFTVLCKPAPREFGGGGGGGSSGGGSGAGAGTGSSGLHSTTGSGSASDIADAELDEAEANAVLEDLDFADGTSAGALRRARHAAQVCRGKRVLLAEDNAFNAEIITAYLTASAVEVVWASNGEQAVRAFKAAVLEEGRPFDCVLMDCQMPILDGWAATRELRRWEAGRSRAEAEAEDEERHGGNGGTNAAMTVMSDDAEEGDWEPRDGAAGETAEEEEEGGTPAGFSSSSSSSSERRTPIVALTAYAMESDKARCLGAGMDVVVTKPVQRVVLTKVIAHLLRGTGGASSDSASEVSHGAGGEQPQPQPQASSSSTSAAALTASLNAHMHAQGDGSNSNPSWGATTGSSSDTTPNAARIDITGSRSLTSSSSLLGSGSNAGSTPKSHLRTLGGAVGGATGAGRIGSGSLGALSGVSGVSGLGGLGGGGGGGGGSGMLNYQPAITAHLQAANYQPIDEALGQSQFGSSRAVYYKMMSKFAVEYLPQGFAAICTAAAAHDAISLRMEAHSLKGSAAFVGASALSETCERLMSVCGLEGEITQWQQKFIDQLIAQLEAEFEMLNSYFESTYDITLHDAPGGRANSLGGTSSLKSGGGEGDLEEDGEDDMVGLYAQDLARCRGARCLFAEDNEFTVEVLKCLVSGAGMHAQWVTDGRAAVEAVASAPSAFDVIVMDCQMPLMGGVEASKQIRAAEVQRAAEAAAAGAGAGAAPSTVVIIGLSAYELHRKQCEAAGMNKFVVKPIGRAALIHLIAEVMGARRPASAAAAGGADSNASPSLRPGGLAESRVVFCPIDEAKAQRALGGTRELLRSALSRFATGELKRVDALEAALAASDWKALHMGAHALKGSASSIAAASLASACARLQQACCEDGTLAGGEGAGAQAAVAELVSALRGEAERMRAYANKFSGGGAAAATAAAAAVSSVWGDEGGAAEASAAESGFATKAATTAEGAPVLVVAGTAATAATAAAAAAAAAAPAAGSALDLSRFASFSARELQSWARDVLLMPEQVCEALHQANVDGEDAKEFSDEDWAQLAAECELSGMVVNKLRRKCRKAAADAEARAAAEESAAGLEELCDV